MDAPNELDRPRAVFVDETGRRRRAMRWSGTAVGAVFLTYLALLVASFARAPFVGHLSLPGIGSPAVGQASHPPSLGDSARTSPAPDLHVTVPPTSPPVSTTTTTARAATGSPGTTVNPARTATTTAGAKSAPTTVAAAPTTIPAATTVPPATTTTTTHGNGRTTGRTTTTNPRRP